MKEKGQGTWLLVQLPFPARAPSQKKKGGDLAKIRY